NWTAESLYIVKMSQREDLLKFETGRIKALQEERLHIQKKTFTKWMNSFLAKARMEVEDLFIDLADGKKLLKLLEIISGEKLGKPNSGKMRVHKIENVNKSLAFLHTKVRLESIGAEDIVDGNPRLILGLLWTIILRFQIQEIEIDVNEDDESSEKKSAKDALLLWCQRKTNGYKNVNITDFSGSWRSGMGFNALIHSHRPDLIDYNSLNPTNHIENLDLAFDVAERELGVSKLLDAEDIDTSKPDEKSVMTYVSSFYHTFARMKSEIKGGRRIANIIGQLMEIDRLQYQYESFTAKLLTWIQNKTAQLNGRDFPNSLDSIQGEMIKFKDYRTVEKPPKYKERSEIEALLFNIQTKMKSLGQPLYVPPEGKYVQDIQKAWESLEKAEHLREVALREELLRLEKLENLAFRFERKSILREGYLKEMIQVLSDPRYGSNLSQVEATVKKHEAISADILAREERIESLTTMANELIDGNYHGKDAVASRRDDILKRWKYLLDLLQQRKDSLTAASNLMSSMRELDTVRNEIKEMQKSLSFEESVGARHLSAVEDLLQNQHLMEMQITSQGETIRKLCNTSSNLLKQNQSTISKEAELLKQRLDSLNNDYLNLNDTAKHRHNKLEEMRQYFQFVEDEEEVEAWIIERQRICQAVLPSKDLLGVISLQQKHKALEAEIKAHRQRIRKVIEGGENLLSHKHTEENDIRLRIGELQKQWDHLHELVALKRKQLEDAVEAFQYHADANEAESWMKEKMQLVTSKDYGKDEPSVSALLQRHSRLESEVNAYENDIKRLNDQSENMIKSGIASLFMICGDAFSASTAVNNGDSEEVPAEEWVEELIEKEVMQDVVEEIKIAQVKVLYPFSGQDGFDITKGEILLLLEKTNQDWWNVRKASGWDGFVPANYVQEIEEKAIKKVVKKPVKVLEKQKVKKIVKKSKKFKRNNKRRLSIICDAEGVEQRQRNINSTYDELVELAKARRQHLEDALQLFRFNRECSNFESWMKEKESSMLETQALHQQKMQEKQKKQPSTVSDPIEILKKKFENFITDLSANRQRVDDIDRMASEFTTGRQQHYSAAIKQRQQQIHHDWDKLNRLRNDIGKNVEGLSTVDMFNQSCDDAIEWMNEKIDKMEFSDNLTRDLKTIQALQRKHENLERELAPIEEKINKVTLLADSVKNAYPSEKRNVIDRQVAVKEKWEKVKEKAVEKRHKLDESLGLQILKNSTLDLLSWSKGYVKQALTSDDTSLIKDVATAEMFLKNHEDLGCEIAAKSPDFKDLQELGTQLLKQKPNDEMMHLLKELKDEHEIVCKSWQEKDNWLKQCKDLMIFNQEADHWETINNSHLTYLEYDDLGTTLDDVEVFIKRHDNFLATLAAQEERFHHFNEMANKLINARHYNSTNVDARRKQIIEKRNYVKDKALQRQQDLKDALSYQQFRADAEDFSSWCADKIKVASDDSYKDMINMEQKLQKHEAFEAELGSSHSRLLALNRAGQLLVDNDHFAFESIKQILDDVNSQWEELCSKTGERGMGLRQALAQATYNRTIEHAKVKLDELETSLSSAEFGNDLRNCKELIKKHQATEIELSACESKINELVDFGEQMATTHFDGENIRKGCADVKGRLNKLFVPSRDRKQKLNESLKYHQFVFEVNAELQWISDRETSANLTDCIQSLLEAQNLLKKHQKLEREITGHKIQIDKTLANGHSLIAQGHVCEANITQKCDELEGSWKNLISLSVERQRKLDAALKSQMFLFEGNEIETWINEKLDYLKSTGCGKDEDAVIKLLTKQKALELEIDTYEGLLKEMKHQCNQMVESKKHNDEEKLVKRVEDLEEQLKNLQQIVNVRRDKLIESKHFHEYVRESEDFHNWIMEQMQAAGSEEYGQDYERLLIIQSKFHDFKRRVEASLERFNLCEEMAEKLLKTDKSVEVQARQEQLKDAWLLLLDHIDARNQKLIAAAEIHRFNRDVAEALSRIQEKYSLVNVNDTGKDLHSVQSLLRKHEGFENDLVALETQLQVLIDDSARLQAAYPGGNAEHILKQQQLVVQQWNTLQERAALRKDHIQASYQLQRFISSVRDLERWADSLGTEIGTQEKVRDVVGAQELKTEHERIKAEIETRESDFSAVVKRGETLINEEKHFATTEIKLHLTRLLQCREALHTAWQLKKVYLDQLTDLHFFLRDAKQLDQLSAQQEHILTTCDLGTTVEQIDANIKKHEAFEKLLLSQDEKLSALQFSGNKLLQQNHFDSETIKRRMDDVTTRRLKVKELSKKRMKILHDQRILAQFRRDVVEAESWIEDRIRRMNADQLATRDVFAAETQLNRHKEYKAEIDMRTQFFEEFKIVGEGIIRKGHSMSEEVKDKIDRLMEAWSELHDTWNKRLFIYEQNLDAQIFRRDADHLESWLQSKMVVLKDGSLGDSLEEVEELIQSHDGIMRNAQEERFEALMRVTLVEEMFQKQQQAEKERLNHKERDSKLNLKDNRRSNHEKKKDDTDGSIGFVKRVESFIAPKGSRHSSHRNSRSASELPPVEIEGILDRKHELQSSGKKATARSWKTYYTVLCGQLLCFFKDKDNFIDNVAASSPVSVLGAKCFRAANYTKRKHVFRLQLFDGSEYLFAVGNEQNLNEWMNKVSFHASLPPSMQLLSYDTHKRTSTNRSSSNPESPAEDVSNTSTPVQEIIGKCETSSQGSSSPEFQRNTLSGDIELKTPPSPSKRPPPPPPPGEVHSRPPAPLPVGDTVLRGPPPLPPPRTVTVINNRPEDEVYDLEYSRRNETNGARSSSFRQSYPPRQTNNSHNGDMSNSHEGKH
ncbi:spectrin beta chain: non-erythrocytic 1-like protein, partial [Leptotrombidium deliense]